MSAAAFHFANRAGIALSDLRSMTMHMVMCALSAVNEQTTRQSIRAEILHRLKKLPKESDLDGGKEAAKAQSIKDQYAMAKFATMMMKSRDVH